MLAELEGFLISVIHARYEFKLFELSCPVSYNEVQFTADMRYRSVYWSQTWPVAYHTGSK